jgi:Ca2+-binding EF-hand superfamily protein
LFQHPFNPTTLIWLAAKYAAKGGGVIGNLQFCEMMLYLENLKDIFGQIDTDNSGNISVAEFSRALHLSGFIVNRIHGGGDALTFQVAEKIGRAYDLDGNGVLTFDEFVLMRLEWDNYLDSWSNAVPPGMDAIDPLKLVEILETIKKKVEPVSVLAFALSNLSGFCPQSFLGPVYYTSMFSVPQPLLPATVLRLIQNFGSFRQPEQGALWRTPVDLWTSALNFEQFCMMMNWLKLQKKRFVDADVDRSGSISVPELERLSGRLSKDQVLAIAGRYGLDESGQLGFDQFLQMMIDINPNE